MVVLDKLGAPIGFVVRLAALCAYFIGVILDMLTCKKIHTV